MYYFTLKTLPDDPSILNAIYDAAPADATPEQLVPEIITDEHGNARPFNIVRVPQPADLTDAGALVDFYLSLFERGRREFGEKKAPAISVPVLPAGTPNDRELAEKSLSAVIEAVQKFTKKSPKSDLTLVLSIDMRRFPKPQCGFLEVFGYCEKGVPYENEIRSRRAPSHIRFSIAPEKSTSVPGKSTGVPAADETRRVERAVPDSLMFRIAAESGYTKASVPADFCIPFEEFEPKNTFRDVLFQFIQIKNISDVNCYTRARIDRRLFSKIKSNRYYQPTRETACAFAIALNLNIKETLFLLKSAGFALSRGRRYDNVIRFFVEKEFYDFDKINFYLHSLGEKMFGVS